jgi:hypothetical protein
MVGRKRNGVKGSVTSEYHILNLGAGVQSTDLYLRAARGEVQPFDYAICADTQDEFGAVHRRKGLPDPAGSFYAHLDWLGTQAAYLDSQSPLIESSNHGGSGCPILIRTRGQISADLLEGKNSSGQRFASIPAYTSHGEGLDEGQTRRQCTKEYKVEVIERCIRHELLGLPSGARVPPDTVVHQYIGISWDERSRAFDIARRFEIQDTEEVVQLGLWDGEETVIAEFTGRRQKANWRVHFPFIERGNRITRADCKVSLRRWVPYEVEGSSCVECPYKDDATWQKHMDEPETRSELIHIDYGIRRPGAIVNRNMEQSLYLHRSCRPIDKIDFTKGRQSLGFAMECEGGCGL